ncbi:ATP-binding protein [Spirillospora sp. CA-294931]|uniref:ATP-binding protein n=1 Tax=Spirillospora sp. CA-294931 TaxID=3240042 RepID=UPI003D92F1F2
MKGGWYASLRLRLATAFVAVALLASVLASGIAYPLVRTAMVQRTQDAQLTEVRQTISRFVPTTIPTDSGREIARRVENALRTPNGDRRAWATPLLVTRETPLTPPPGSLHVPLDRAFVAALRDGMKFRRVIHKGRPYLLIGAIPANYVTDGYEPDRAQPPVLVVSVSLHREEADLRSFTRSLAIADAAALLLALVLAHLATRGVLRPVRHLGRAARALGDGELHTRVDVRGRDELADLARTFNATAEALERTVTELRAIEAASRRFVADVSHELRTPLTSMVAVTDLMAEEPAAAALVAAETRRLGQLVEHLIEVSRFDAGAASLVLDDVDVMEAIARTLASRGWSGRLEVDGPARLTVRLDPRRFDVIVANLVGNALGHGRPPVRLEVREAGGVELVVTDAGPGIPDDLLPVVFDRFVKGEAARAQSEGSGLGLSIARENALLHGGTLGAANVPGAGAMFTLWIPAGREEQ